MDLFSNLILRFEVALTLQNLWFCFIGVFLGALIGVLPGIGPLATITMRGRLAERKTFAASIRS